MEGKVWGWLTLCLCRLVDEITYKKACEAADTATQSAILGPFFQNDNPTLEKGASIYRTKAEKAEVVYMYGRVVDNKTGKPLANATIDIWQASTNGRLSVDLVKGVGADLFLQVSINSKIKTSMSTTCVANLSRMRAASTLVTASDRPLTLCHMMAPLESSSN